MKLYEIIWKKISSLWTKEETPGKSRKYPGELVLHDQPEARRIPNPLNFVIGDYTSLDLVDYRGRNFKVEKINEYDVAKLNDVFVDYFLSEFDTNGNANNVKLRHSGEKVLLLRLYDSLAYNAGLHDAVKDPSGQFNIDDDQSDDNPDNDTHDEYWRVGDVKISYSAQLRNIGLSKNNELIVLESMDVELWDYSRLTNIDGVQKEQYVFVELNKTNGWFEIWQGMEINPDKIFHKGA